MNDPLIEAIDPTGGVEHLAYHYASPAWPDSVPAAEVPAGFVAHNTNLSAWNTVSWDAAAWVAGPGDLATATVTGPIPQTTNGARLRAPGPDRACRSPELGVDSWRPA